MRIIVRGAAEAKSHLQAIAYAAASSKGVKVQVGSPLNYAYGIEYGRHRNGKLARRAGGAMYLNRGLASVQATIPALVAAALPHGAGAVLQALKTAGFNVEAAAKRFVPVVSHTLQRSIQTIYPGRPVQAFAPAARSSTRRSGRGR